MQCSCLENPRDGGAWWAAIYGVAESRTRLKQLSSSSSMYMLSCFSHVDHDKLWKDLREMGMPDHLACLLRNLYEVSGKPDQEATVITLYGKTDWFKIEKGVRQGYLLPPSLFNPHTEHIMRNAGLDELQAGIKIGRRNINNLRHVDDTTLRVESEEELKRLLMRVKEESKRASLKLNTKKT